jgi:hypothetical protein
MGFVPTGVCRHCKRPLVLSGSPDEGWDWQDNLGWFICPSPPQASSRRHYPVEPVEGIDY